MELAHCSFLVSPSEQFAVPLFWDLFVLLCDLSSLWRPTPGLGICIFSLQRTHLGHKVWGLGAGSLCGWGSAVSRSALHSFPSVQGDPALSYLWVCPLSFSQVSLLGIRDTKWGLLPRSRRHWMEGVMNWWGWSGLGLICSGHIIWFDEPHGTIRREFGIVRH